MSATTLAPTWWDPRGAYIHVPFCFHHCAYCDFAVSSGRDHLIDHYLEALAIEIGRIGTPQPMETIFIGGGTPTYLEAGPLARLLDSIARWLPISPGSEYSIEATPESITAEKVGILAEAGVNRVSLGVQTFDGELLKRLDRRHDPQQIRVALELLRQRIENVSIDLIFAIPGQTLLEWQSDLEQAVSQGTPHISTYGLTYEKGTPLWKQLTKGEVTPLGDELERSMYEWSMDYLGQHGYGHYEISNFARPGAECRHNEKYWGNEAYFGFGVGAASYVRGVRANNRRSTEDYIRLIYAGETAEQSREELAPLPRAKETAAIQLRRAKGIVKREYLTQTGFAIEEVLSEAFGFYRDEGFLQEDEVGIRLTRPGRFVADTLVTKVVFG